MGTAGFFVVFCFCLYSATGQRIVQPVTQDPIVFFNNPNLLDLAVRANNNVTLEFRGPQMTLIVQEDVNVNFDCYPWASNFRGGSIRWYIMALTETLEPRSINFQLASNQTRLSIGGTPPEDRWLNITGTVGTEGAADPDFGRYRCEVCVARDTPQESCHNSTTLLFIAGAPPDIIEGEDNVPISRVTAGDIIDFTYNYGSDFCIDPLSGNKYTIFCNFATSPKPLPEDFRLDLLKDGEIFSTFMRSDGSAMRTINSSFYEVPGNEIFAPGQINPPDPVTLFGGAAIGVVLETNAFNLSMNVMFTDDLTLTSDEIRRRVGNALVGGWTCQASNLYGNDSETSVVRLCEGVPSFPGCEGGATAIFPSESETVPVGCTICIPRGSSVTIDCNAMTPSMQLTYSWRQDNSIIPVFTRTLRVTEEATYTCSASNLDNPNTMETSVLVYSDSITFESKILDRAGTELQGDGCSRLRDDVRNTTDICVFIGDQVDLSCSNMQTQESLNVTRGSDGSIIGRGFQVVDAGFEDTYSCTLNTLSACRGASRNMVVRVFDPARIVRDGALSPADALGVGRFTDVQRVSDGASVTLSCDTNGIDTPTTNWFLVNVTDDGCGVESPVTQGVTTTDGDSTLTISNFGDSDIGTYICRTDNIAGRDAASIVVTSVQESADWTNDTEFGECTLMCVEGFRTRSVSCRDQDGRILPDFSCDVSTRPAAVENCSLIFPNECLLTPIYGVGSFSECSGGCSGGYKDRDVFCFIPMTREKVSDNDCASQRRPDRFSLCRNTCCVSDGHDACTSIRGASLESVYCRFPSVAELCCWTCRNFQGFDVAPTTPPIPPTTPPIQ